MELACNVFIDKSFLIYRAGEIQSPDRLHGILVLGEGSGSRLALFTIVRHLSVFRPSSRYVDGFLMLAIEGVVVALASFPG